MPRRPRAAPGGYCYHVLNRANGRFTVFHEPADYAAFVNLLDAACQRIPMRVLAYCLMPNHFHLVVWPAGDADLSAWMHWLSTTHVSRYHKKHKSTGHLWQGRYKAFPIQEDEHLLAVLRYVERNPLRANLVTLAEDWPFSSLHGWQAEAGPAWLHPGPVPRGGAWGDFVNRPQTEEELKRISHSIRRGAPFGDEVWIARTARQLGLETTLRPRGRPRKAKEP